MRAGVCVCGNIVLTGASNNHKYPGPSNGQVAVSALGSGCACPTAVIAFCPSCQRPALHWASCACSLRALLPRCSLALRTLPGHVYIPGGGEGGSVPDPNDCGAGGGGVQRGGEGGGMQFCVRGFGGIVAFRRCIGGGLNAHKSRGARPPPPHPLLPSTTNGEWGGRGVRCPGPQRPNGCSGRLRSPSRSFPMFSVCVNWGGS